MRPHIGIVAVFCAAVLLACATLAPAPTAAPGQRETVVACAPLRVVLPMLSQSLTGSKLAAVTIGNQTVYFGEAPPSEALRCHEAFHVTQQARDGAEYYLRYAAELFKHGYRNNALEVEARKACGQE